MTAPVIPYADVTMYGAFDPDGEVYHKCRITMNGKPADAVLYHHNPDRDIWLTVDRLTQATVTDHNDGTLTIEGISDELVNVVGTEPVDAIVRWEVQPRGCINCG